MKIKTRQTQMKMIRVANKMTNKRIKKVKMLTETPPVTRTKMMKNKKNSRTKSGWIKIKPRFQINSLKEMNFCSLKKNICSMFK